MKVRFPLHADQARVYGERRRYNVLSCGRRWGKSSLGKALVINPPLLGIGDAWWIFPSYPIAREGWRMLRSAAHAISQGLPGIQVREVDRAVIFPGGKEARIRSADDPDSLRGSGLARAVLDEAALLSRRAWEEAIRPALIDREGDAFFLTTPRGKDWIHGLYMRGQDPAEPDWASWQRTTFDNPELPATEKAALRADYEAGRISEHTWRQEILGEFVEFEGAVFRRILDACSAEPVAPVPGRSYLIGVDLAKSHDFTVLSVWDTASRTQVALDRFNEISYPFQEKRVADLARRYNAATVVVETNNTGEAFCDHLERAGVRVVRWTTTGANKSDAVEALALAIENGEATLLRHDLQIAELQAYERKKSANGLRYTYSAPDGGHDDIVMADVIAWTELGVGASVGFLVA